MPAGWTCSVCGSVHDGVPLDWGFDHPDFWEQERDQADGFLNADLCVIAHEDGPSDYFVRGLIEIPILNSTTEGEEYFGIGVWVSLSEMNFKWYVDHPEAGEQEQGAPWFGWLSNGVPAYPDTMGLRTDVCLRGAEWRPSIFLQDGDHPLVFDQRSGIQLARAREMSARWRHS